MNPIDFSRPQRMSRGAYFIIMGNALKRLSTLFVTLLVVKLFDSQAREYPGVAVTVLYFCGLWVALAALMAFFSYFFKKFYVADGNLVVMHGVLQRQTTSIPLDRIHSLRTQKGVLYRMFDMVGIVFDTLASREEELEIILTESDWRRLLTLIDKGERQQLEHTAAAAEADPATTVVFPTTRLLLVALCQNHLRGMAVLAPFFAVVIDHLSDLPEGVAGRMAGGLGNFFGNVEYTVWGIVLTFLVAYLLILFLWLGRVLVRYGDMTMSYTGSMLTFTHGLFTKGSSRFYHDKICTIRIKRNFLEQRFGFSTVMLQQALNASVKKEDDQIKIYDSYFSGFFLDWWLGRDTLKEADIASARSGNGVVLISILFPLALTAAAVAVLCHYRLYVWLIAVGAYLLLSIVNAVLTKRHSRIQLKPSCILVHGGGFASVASYLKYGDVEVVALRRTPFSRYTRRVTLTLSTSGTTFRLRSLPEAAALPIYERLLTASSD